MSKLNLSKEEPIKNSNSLIKKPRSTVILLSLLIVIFPPLSLYLYSTTYGEDSESIRNQAEQVMLKPSERSTFKVRISETKSWPTIKKQIVKLEKYLTDSERKMYLRKEGGGLVGNFDNVKQIISLNLFSDKQFSKATFKQLPFWLSNLKFKKVIQIRIESLLGGEKRIQYLAYPKEKLWLYKAFSDNEASLSLSEDGFLFSSSNKLILDSGVTYEQVQDVAGEIFSAHLSSLDESVFKIPNDKKKVILDEFRKNLVVD